MEHMEDPKLKIENYPNEDELKDLLKSLEHRTNWDGRCLWKYQGFWCSEIILRPVVSSRKYFKAENSDIILASLPKSGTTWLKALAFCIANRNVFSMDENPLLTSNPHKLVPFLDFDIDWNKQGFALPFVSGRRILSTHLPFHALPESIVVSDCKIIYICRNPLDTFISTYFFLLKAKLGHKEPLEHDEAFDMFCCGLHAYGPFWDHVLSYWNAHLTSYSHRVLFIMYEDLKENNAFHVKRIAEFIGLPLSPEEEKNGVVDQISSLCSFDKLSSLEVNKTGTDNVRIVPLKNSSFFRKGEVGDWANHLSPTMVERLKKIMEVKFQDTGIKFKI